MTPKTLKETRWAMPDFTTQDGLTLSFPRIRIKSVNYDVDKRIATVEVGFREAKGDANFEHFRYFQFSLPEESEESISAENVKLFIKSTFPAAEEL